MNSQLLPLFISYRNSGEKLIKYQSNSSCVIMSVIPMTTLFYKALILQGEIWCWSLLGLKGLNRPVSMYLNSYLAPRFGGTKQKKCIIHCWVSRWFLLFYPHKPRSQVWILSYQNWSFTVEPRYNEGPRKWQNLFAKPRFRYTVEPRYNEPLYNQVLGITNDFPYPSNSKMCEKEPRYNRETSV